MSAILFLDDATRSDTAVQSGSVVVWRCPETHAYASEHEHATRTHFARRIATLKQLDFAGDHDPARAYAAPLYFVPNDTIAGLPLARSLGIAGVHDLFGGVVPHPFVATKAITHGLVGRDAARPEGWAPPFAAIVSSAVLNGYSAFSLEDARTAGHRILASGPVRLKPVHATGGRGQTVAADPDALERALAAADPAEIAVHGTVLEENLRDPATYSVGHVVIDDTLVSYHGRQRLTRDNRGEWVYGGSDLTLVRGGYEALLATPGLRPELRLAIDQAQRYHQAVVDCYPGFVASRVNYDVAQGCGPGGRWRSGVLEQSWRVGGATGAEIAALEHFRDQPANNRICASCFEAYGAATVPSDAIVYYQGVDAQAGPLTKYAVVEPHADAS